MQFVYLEVLITRYVLAQSYGIKGIESGQYIDYEMLCIQRYISNCVLIQPKQGYGTPIAIQKISFMRGFRWGRGPTPPENSQVIWVSIENSIWIPHPGKSWTSWKMVDPPGLMMELPLKPGKSNFF